MQVFDPASPDPRTPEEGVLNAFMRVGRRMRAKQAGDPVDHSQHVVLWVLYCGGPQRLSDLAAKAGIDASTVSRHVKALEDRGLVTRSPDPDDRRAFRVDLSDEGRSQFEAASARRKALLTQAMADWDPEDVRTFERLMTRFADGVAALAENESAPDVKEYR